VLEIAQKKEQEEKKIMFDEKTMRDVIVTAINETNSKNSEYEATITELNSTIAERDNTIVELNATVEQVRQALADLEAERETYWAEREALQKELGELQAKARLGELNAAIENFTDEEKAYAEVEINSFNEDPMSGDVDAIVNKIYAGIGTATKKAEADAKIAEQNSANKDTDLDIFSGISSVENDSDEEINIF
jgi:uncharacterized coiled-coil protein SlyX